MVWVPEQLPSGSHIHWPMHAVTVVPWNIPYGLNQTYCIGQNCHLLADLLLDYFNTNKTGPRHRHWQWSTIICSILTASTASCTALVCAKQHCPDNTQAQLRRHQMPRIASRRQFGHGHHVLRIKEVSLSIWRWSIAMLLGLKALVRSIHHHRSCFPVQPLKAELYKWGYRMPLTAAVENAALLENAAQQHLRCFQLPLGCSTNPAVTNQVQKQTGQFWFWSSGKVCLMRACVICVGWRSNTEKATGTILQVAVILPLLLSSP